MAYFSAHLGCKEKFKDTRKGLQAPIHHNLIRFYLQIAAFCADGERV
jgi:hypothetical protein